MMEYGKMSLYRVRIEYDTVVAANSEREAERTGERIVRCGDEEPLDSYASEIKNVDDLPDGWDPDECYPWGEESERTIRQILADSVMDNRVDEWSAYDWIIALSNPDNIRLDTLTVTHGSCEKSYFVMLFDSKNGHRVIMMLGGEHASEISISIDGATLLYKQELEELEMSCLPYIREFLLDSGTDVDPDDNPFLLIWDLPDYLKWRSAEYLWQSPIENAGLSFVKEDDCVIMRNKKKALEIIDGMKTETVNE
jgi:hypothetical protein